MWIRARGWWLPKDGNQPEEYEDAFRPRDTIDRESSRFRCAVADGATETSFAELWAEMLVTAWTENRLGPRRLAANLPGLQRAWLDRAASRPLPWYAEEKLRSGAYASFLGLSITDQSSSRRDGRRWHATAIGDSCLFLVQDGALRLAFPLTDADQFGNRPLLISSNPAQNDGLFGQVLHAAGRWEQGDVFYLASDALASWFLRTAAAGEKPWCILESGFASESDFERWVHHLRCGGQMRNDDVTLLQVHVD